MSNPHYCELAAPFGNQGPIVVKIVYWGGVTYEII
jgi:hypothetical protein